MKQILFWKYVDITGQAIMALPLIFLVSPERRCDALLVFFTVGSWQTISCILTAIFGGKPGPDRRQFQSILVRIWIIGVLAGGLIRLATAINFNDPAFLAAVRGLSEFMILAEIALILIAGPILAIWYASVTLEEIRVTRLAIRHRSGVHWKS